MPLLYVVVVAVIYTEVAVIVVNYTNVVVVVVIYTAFTERHLNNSYTEKTEM